MDPGRIAVLVNPRPKRAPTPDLEENRLVPLPRVAEFYGVSLRTVDRWLQRPELDFPKPTKINGRRYLRLSQILAWDERRGAGTAD